ncbi:hypothetical protein RB2654_14395 [Rhodobacterales bacterium HTCC2654]|uniref:Uncharacterized protein n=1 Tax=Maritimibacter alkaliphilus HTCC2654 TaxID=314271 RepID=A3VGS8_9RHOB|nr:hypothetical protein RB2654_14395 [Rhodobacterales bacterium HTCC2654] [Maritimibacter alkaliphilus HTCC2654]
MIRNSASHSRPVSTRSASSRKTFSRIGRPS